MKIFIFLKNIVGFENSSLRIENSPKFQLTCAHCRLKIILLFRSNLEWYLFWVGEFPKKKKSIFIDIPTMSTLLAGLKSTAQRKNFLTSQENLLTIDIRYCQAFVVRIFRWFCTFYTKFFFVNVIDSTQSISRVLFLLSLKI